MIKINPLQSKPELRRTKHPSFTRSHSGHHNTELKTLRQLDKINNVNPNKTQGEIKCSQITLTHSKNGLKPGATETSDYPVDY